MSTVVSTGVKPPLGDHYRCIRCGTVAKFSDLDVARGSWNVNAIAECVNYHATWSLGRYPYFVDMCCPTCECVTAWRNVHRFLIWWI